MYITNELWKLFLKKRKSTKKFAGKIGLSTKAMKEEIMKLQHSFRYLSFGKLLIL